jgi:hopanoid C-2 methylase
MPPSTLLPPTIPVAESAPGSRDRYRPENVRRVLCVFPRYTHSFGTFDHAFPLMRVRAFMPPQGILVVAAYLPAEWEIRFVDENVRPASDADYRWADVVFMSGMHVQKDHIREINERAHRFGKLTILGGPSVSGCPEWYPEVDLLHVGELGDATEAILRRLDASTARPERQEVYTTTERLPLAEFPLPAYHLISLNDYFLGSVQFSSGCPYRCEFCDIPELYGRNPRLKTPEQVTAELDAMLARGNPGAVYFVDDNFIGNQKAALALLEALVRWQQERGYPIQLACEATLNLAQVPRALELMREAAFRTVFCGIETPEEHALEAMQKKQNLRQPILEAVRALNSYGLEVVSGIIIGLDTDTPTTGERIAQFIETSRIPMLTINLLHALPKTPLWRRLEAEGRLLDGEGRESNVEFLLPHETVVRMWQETITRAYTPEAIYDRFDYQIRETFANRKTLPNSRARVNFRMIRRGVRLLSRVIWHAGIRSDYRKRFWQTALPALKEGKIEEVIHVGVVAHHMIMFARECAAGGAEKSFYSPTRGETPALST